MIGRASGVAQLFPSFVLSNPQGQDNYSLRLWLPLSLAGQDLPQDTQLLRSSTYCPVEYGVGVRGHFGATEECGKYTGCPQEAAAAVTSERGPSGTHYVLPLACSVA